VPPIGREAMRMSRNHAVTLRPKLVVKGKGKGK
jgi:hypothetical protein